MPLMSHILYEAKTTSAAFFKETATLFYDKVRVGNKLVLDKEHTIVQSLQSD